MARTKLDQKEQELLEAYESGLFESDLDAGRREYLAEAAKETLKKDKRINMLTRAAAFCTIFSESERLQHDC